MQNNGFYTNKTLTLHGRLLTLEPPRVMGILNITPDSFYDGGRFTSDKAILDQVEKMLIEGASIIDVGGYSTRPGADEITEETELSRVLPAIRSIEKEFAQTHISIDTFRSAVAIQAVATGAALINDISGGQDPKMFEVVAGLKVPYVLMHTRGTPATMSTLTDYQDLLREIVDFFQEKIYRLQQLGVSDIIVDPGFGFAKTVEQNFFLLHHLDHLMVLGRPLLAGLSRKSMVWRSLDITPEQALTGTTALNSVALMKGASLLRVHDVKEATQCIRLISKLQGG